MPNYKSDFIIFLVDDDTDDQGLFSDALQKIDLNYQLRTFDDGVTLINSLYHSLPLPDFIFLDLYMPLMDGEECLRDIRQIEKCKHIPVIIYSTSYNPEQIAHLFSMGANRFIQKSTSFAALIASLERALIFARDSGVTGEPMFDLVQ